MPVARRAHEVGGNSTQGRRAFHSMPEFKRARSNGNNDRSSNRGDSRPAPPEATHAENFYYLKQMNSKTPIVVVLTDGEEIHGCIEWYDKNCLKVNRDGAPNLLIQKHCIKYVFKQEEIVR